MALDILAAEAMHRAALLERAVHDPGPWTIGYGSHVVPACRWVKADRVIFAGHFPDACWIEPDAALNLFCRGEMVGSKPIERPEDGEFSVTWEIGLQASVRA